MKKRRLFLFPASACNPPLTFLCIEALGGNLVTMKMLAYPDPSAHYATLRASLEIVPALQSLLVRDEG